MNVNELKNTQLGKKMQVLKNRLREFVQSIYSLRR